MQSYNIPKLEGIVAHYKAKHRKQVDYHVAFCIAQSSLKDCIGVAARAIDDLNKIHFHQRRVGRTALANFAEKLLLLENDLNTATTFDAIFELIKNTNAQGINEITVFDTAFRIGSYRKILPDKIYLISGTRIGAEVLLGKLDGKTTLSPEELPSPFHRKDLTVADIEDILFLYKDELVYCVKN